MIQNLIYGKIILPCNTTYSNRLFNTDLIVIDDREKNPIYCADHN